MNNLIAITVHKGFSLIGFKSFKSQYMLSFLLVLLCGMAIITSQYLTLGNDATAINIAGRQRMLSQRLAKEALLVGQQLESREVLQKTIQLFESSHEKLLKGDPEQGMDAIGDEVIIQQMKKVEGLWLEYKNEINYYLDSTGASAAKIHKLSPVVLKEMNQAVGMMANLANQQVKQQQLISLVATILLMVMLYVGREFGKNLLLDKMVLLQQHLRLLSQGDFSKPIENSLPDTEVGDTIQAYNQVLANVSDMIQGVTRVADHVIDDAGSATHALSDTEQGVEQQKTDTH